MDNWLAALLSGFAGAIIGAASSVAVVFVQIRADRRKEMMKLAMEAAVKEHNVHLEAALKVGQSIACETVLPVSSYVYFYVKLFQLLEKEQISEKSLVDLYIERDKLTELVRGRRSS